MTPYVVAFLNFQRPDLAMRMIEPLKETHLVALDNGSQPALLDAIYGKTQEYHDYSLALPGGVPYIVWPEHRFPNWQPVDSPANYAPNPVTRLYRVAQNLYYGGGSNWLMARIFQDFPETEAVWLCNDDILNVSPQMAEALFGLLKETGAAGVSPAIRGTTHRSTQPQATGTAREVNFFDVTAPMFAAWAWKELGGYDPDFIGFGTDVDWCARARKRGWKLLVDDRLVVDHPDPATTCITQGTMLLHSDPKWVHDILRKHGKTWERLTTEGP